MSNPELLFAFRKVFYEGKWHLRCINCGPNSAEQWDWDKTWNLLPSGHTHSIAISLPPSDCETSSIPRGPLIVYGMDPVVKALPTFKRVYAITAQNYAIVVSNADLNGLELPCFLGVQNTCVERIELVVSLESAYLDDLKEVRAYIKRIRTDSATVDDLLMLEPLGSTKEKIPSGLLLPATVEQGDSRIPVVYSVMQWRTERTALIECYLPEPVSIHENAQISREIAIDGRLLSRSALGNIIELQPV